MAVRYQCDRCGRYFDDPRDFRHVKVWSSWMAPHGTDRPEPECGGRQAVHADLCQECSGLLIGFIEGVC